MNNTLHITGLRFVFLAFGLSFASCLSDTNETDRDLVYRCFTRGEYEMPFFRIDREYQGTAGKVYFVRISDGSADTLLAVVGIHETPSHDFAWPIGMPINLHESGTAQYSDYLTGDTIYRLFDTTQFWNDTTIWIDLIDNLSDEDTVMRAK